MRWPSLGDDSSGPSSLILGVRGEADRQRPRQVGHIARKIAATFASTGTTALLHLAEAIHGDLGMAAKGDVTILISQSGETAELEPVIDHFRRVQIRSSRSPAMRGPCWPRLRKRLGPAALARGWSRGRGSDDVDDNDVGARRCAGDDGHAAERVHANRFRTASSRRRLRARLKPVSRLMHSKKGLPLTRFDSNMHDVVVEMSAKRLGVIGVTDEAGYLVGVITDGDLRRNIERGLDHGAGEFMTRDRRRSRRMR